MKGKKILAILLAAVCLIGILPLSVCAKTEIIHQPPVIAISLNTRYSNSSGGYITAANSATFTIPIPLNYTQGALIEFDQTINIFSTQYYLTEQFTTISTADVPTGETNYALLAGIHIPANAYFVVINVSLDSFTQGIGITINGDPIQDVYGDHTEAQREAHIEVEVPDDTVTDLTLNLWERIINELLPIVTPFYEALSNPITLLLVIPCCIFLIALIPKLFR